MPGAELRTLQCGSSSIVMAERQASTPATNFGASCREVEPSESVTRHGVSVLNRQDRVASCRKVESIR